MPAAVVGQSVRTRGLEAHQGSERSVNCSRFRHEGLLLEKHVLCFRGADGDKLAPHHSEAHDAVRWLLLVHTLGNIQMPYAFRSSLK